MNFAQNSLYKGKSWWIVSFRVVSQVPIHSNYRLSLWKMRCSIHLGPFYSCSDIHGVPSLRFWSPGSAGKRVEKYREQPPISVQICNKSMVYEHAILSSIICMPVSIRHRRRAPLWTRDSLLPQETQSLRHIILVICVYTAINPYLPTSPPCA